MCAGLLLAISIYSLAQQPSSGGTGAPSSAPGNRAASLPDAPSPSRSPGNPNAPLMANTQPYIPLTSQQKLERWGRFAYSPYTFTSTVLNGAWAEAFGEWRAYGGGMAGYGKRVGATLGNTETSGFFKVFLLPVVLHDDPRLFYSGKSRILPRAWYAATRVLVTRRDDGREVFNTPEILGTFLSAAVTNAYYPRADRGFGGTMTRGFGGITSDAGTNILHEFWPDISRIFNQHEPSRVRTIEEKIPGPIVRGIEGAPPSNGAPPANSKPSNKNAPAGNGAAPANTAPAANGTPSNNKAQQ